MENDSELQKLYEDYVSQNIVITEKYNEYSKQFANNMDNLITKLNNLDKNLIKEIEKIIDLMTKMQEEQSRQSFKLGYSLGREMKIN